MLLPKPIRKFIAIFRGGVSPLMIILSIILGFTFGLIPGFYGVHALILILELKVPSDIKCLGHVSPFHDLDVLDDLHVAVYRDDAELDVA